MNEKSPNSQNADPNFASKGSPAEQGMKIDGLQQVVDLLKHADPAFRESLLRRLTQRDPQLAQQLKKTIR